MNQTEEQVMTEGEDLKRLRPDFLAEISLALLTPLSSIKESVSTLLDPSEAPGRPEPRQFHRIIDEQADRMQKLTNDLLDVTRIESGTLVITPESTNMAALIDTAHQSFANAGGRNSLYIELAPRLPEVIADGPRIVQVIESLLSTASRNSEPGSPIRVGAALVDQHVEVSITGTGIGMARERLPDLFATWPPGADAEADAETRLELARSRGIVEAHEGRIWADSNGSDEGMRLTFTIPASRAAYDEGETSLAPEAGAPRAASEAVTILAVDDDPLALAQIRDTLSNAGFAVVATGDPDEVLNLIKKERPQLVLLDLIMPGIDGIELMKEIREIDDSPVMFLSAFGREEIIAKAFDMGAVDYVVKPYSPTVLSARIRSVLRRQGIKEPSGLFAVKELAIDYGAHRATLGGRPVQLTALEFRLLAELAKNSGRVTTYEQLLRRVWRQYGDGDVRPIRTVVNALRRKLDDDANSPTYIFTESRIGYRMADPRP